MRGVKLFMFLMALPAIAALGFDLYLFYMNQDKGFMLSTPGYIWTHYEPDSYKWTIENTGEYWPYIDMVLAEKSVVVGAVFAGIVYLLLGILKILGVWPFKDDSATRSGSTRADKILGNKSERYKYKRK